MERGAGNRLGNGVHAAGLDLGWVAAEMDSFPDSQAVKRGKLLAVFILQETKNSEVALNAVTGPKMR